MFTIGELFLILILAVTPIMAAAEILIDFHEIKKEEKKEQQAREQIRRNWHAYSDGIREGDKEI